jgi:hypothetical protein
MIFRALTVPNASLSFDQALTVLLGGDGHHIEEHA